MKEEESKLLLHTVKAGVSTARRALEEMERQAEMALAPKRPKLELVKDGLTTTFSIQPPEGFKKLSPWRSITNEPPEEFGDKCREVLFRNNIGGHFVDEANAYPLETDEWMEIPE